MTFNPKTSKMTLAVLAALTVTTTASAHDERHERAETCAPPTFYTHTYSHGYGSRSHGMYGYGSSFGHDWYPSRRHGGLSIHIGGGRSYSLHSRYRHNDDDRDYDDYGHGSYRHGYSRWYGWPDYSRTTRVPRVIVERSYELRTKVPSYRDVPRDPYARYRVGWDALTSGNLYKAREFFSRRATSSPHDPTPKVGFALARAAAGQDDQAEWAMRRAIRYGLDDARDRLPMYDLQPVLARLAARYEDRARAYHDRWLMVAAVRYLMGEDEKAAHAADEALEYDRHDKDAQRLLALTNYPAHD